MTDNTLRWQDEILQLMYWMKGESLGANPTAEELNRLLNFTSAQLEAGPVERAPACQRKEIHRDLDAGGAHPPAKVHISTALSGPSRLDRLGLD